MVPPILIYCLILFVPVLMGRAENRAITIGASNQARIFGFLAVCFFALIVGLRWDVGIDYMSYYAFSSGDFGADYEIERLEFFPRTLAYLTNRTWLPFYVWFVVMAFLQFYFIHKTLKSIYPPLIGWGVFFFIAIFFQEQMNIVRQGVAVCIIMYAYTFLINKKLLPYLLFVIIASLFHKSAIVCLPLFLLSNVKIVLNRFWQYVVVAVLSLLSWRILSSVMQNVEGLFISMGYEGALEVAQAGDLVVERGSGLGILFNYCRFAVLVYYSPMLSKKYSCFGFDFFYLLVFVAMCLYPALFEAMYLQRIFTYITYANVVVLAFLMHYLLQKGRVSLSAILAYIIVFGQLIIYLHQGQNWQFVWEYSQIINLA